MQSGKDKKQEDKEEKKQEQKEELFKWRALSSPSLRSEILSFFSARELKGMARTSKEFAIYAADPKYFLSALKKFLGTSESGTFVQIFNKHYKKFLIKFQEAVSADDFEMAQEAAILLLIASRQADIMAANPNLLISGCFHSIFRGQFESVALKILQATPQENFPVNACFNLLIGTDNEIPNTFLTHAAYYNWCDVHRLLLDKFNANPDVQSSHNQTALTLAVAKGSPIMVCDLLRHHANVGVVADATLRIDKKTYSVRGNALALALYHLCLLRQENYLADSVNITVIIQLLCAAFNYPNIPIESVNGGKIAWKGVLSDLQDVLKLVNKKSKYDLIVRPAVSKLEGSALEFYKLKALFQHYIANIKSPIFSITQKDKDQELVKQILMKWLKDLDLFSSPGVALYNLINRIREAMDEKRFKKLEPLFRRVEYATLFIVGLDKILFLQQQPSVDTTESKEREKDVDRDRDHDRDAGHSP